MEVADPMEVDLMALGVARTVSDTDHTASVTITSVTMALVTGITVACSAGIEALAGQVSEWVDTMVSTTIDTTTMDWAIGITALVPTIASTTTTIVTTEEVSGSRPA